MTMEADIHELEKWLDVSFTDLALLRQALTHRSHSNEVKDEGDNERLEFLGDAVLGLVMNQTLMERFPMASEGKLSKMKACVVSEPTLAAAARVAHLGHFLVLGKGEQKEQGFEKESLLSNAMEAVIAAVYLDQGLPAAREMILRLFHGPLEGVFNRVVDYKTDLQEICQKRFSVLPVYQVMEERGLSDQKRFEVSVSICFELYGRGEGQNKKEAEQMAASIAIEKLIECKPLHRGG